MKSINRRDFLAKSIRSAAGVSLASLAMPKRRVLGANDKVVLALVGAGNRGCRVAEGLADLEGVETKYICEIDETRGAAFVHNIEQKQGYAPKREIEMRKVFDDKDVDGVVIATPEHWHALATVWACQAGKDVLVEKNISLSIWESRKMTEAARKYKRIVQSGAQNRSSSYGYNAREYIKSGKLGKVLHVKVYDMMRSSRLFKPESDSPTPSTLDWNRWLGPATKRPYNRSRHRRWLNYWEYSTGEMGHSASHQIDFARLVLDDPPHPKSVYCAGGRLMFDDKRQIPDLQVVTYDYGDFVMTMEEAGFCPYMKKSKGDVRFADKFPYWPQNATRIEIYGTKQLMYVGRMGGGWQVFEADGKVIEQEHGRFPDKPHQQNFVDCIRSRKMPNGDIESGHYSATLVHLANAATRVGNKQLYFDGKTESFTNCDEANKLLKPHYRGQFTIPDQV